MIETQEDIYVGSIETDRGVREQVRFYDTRGLRDGLELPKHCFSCTDGYVLVYSTDSKESFKRVELLKKEIDKSKDKKEASTPGERGCRGGSAPLLQPLTQRLCISPACHKAVTGVPIPRDSSGVTGCCPGMISGCASAQQPFPLWGWFETRRTEQEGKLPQGSAGKCGVLKGLGMEGGLAPGLGLALRVFKAEPGSTVKLCIWYLQGLFSPFFCTGHHRGFGEQV